MASPLTADAKYSFRGGTSTLPMNIYNDALQRHEEGWQGNPFPHEDMAAAMYDAGIDLSPWWGSARPGGPKPSSGGAGGGGGGTVPTDGLFNNIAQPTGGGQVLDPQMSEVAPPPMPNVARQGLMSASGASTGWQAQPVAQASTQDIGKRIYPPGGTALTQRGRVF